MIQKPIPILKALFFLRSWDRGFRVFGFPMFWSSGSLVGVGSVRRAISSTLLFNKQAQERSSFLILVYRPHLLNPKPLNPKPKA